MPGPWTTSGSRRRRGVRVATAAALVAAQVRFISENIDLTVWRALSTRAGNELLDDEDY